ncbi:MAG: hypothetical protein WCO09_04735, partial [bacterium]
GLTDSHVYTNPYAFVFGYDTDGFMDFRIVSANPLLPSRFYDITDLMDSLNTTSNYLNQISAQVGPNAVKDAKDKTQYYQNLNSEDPTAGAVIPDFSGSVKIASQADLESYIEGETFSNIGDEYNLYYKSRILLDEGDTLNFNLYSSNKPGSIKISDSEYISPIILGQGSNCVQESNVSSGGGSAIIPPVNNPIGGSFADGTPFGPDLRHPPSESDLRSFYDKMNAEKNLHTDTPKLDSVEGICNVLSVAYSLKDRLKTPNLAFGDTVPTFTDSESTMKFWNDDWLEKLNDVQHGISDTGATEMYGKFYKIVGKPVEINLSDLASEEESEYWNWLVGSLNSGKTDCILRTIGHASYVSQLYTKQNGKKVVTIVDTLWQGDDTRESIYVGQHRSGHAFPMINPSKTSFVFDENSVESVSTKTMGLSKEYDPMIKAIAKYWYDYRLGYGTGSTYKSLMPYLDTPFWLRCTTVDK